jgi:ferredoxin-NADP reductase
MTIEIEVKVKEIIQRTYNVKSVRLEVKDEVLFEAGQFFSVTLKSNLQLKRYLSISSSPTEKGYIEFTKKLTQSDFSQALNNLKLGDLVKIQYPFGNFTLKPGFKKIAFLSGGIGITPIRSMCKYAVDKGLDIDIILLYANRTKEDIAFREDFAQMQRNHRKLKVVYVLSEPTPEFQYKEGRINNQLIKQEIPDYLERKFYLCGPPAMVEVMERILIEELALSQENIITENFQGY